MSQSPVRAVILRFANAATHGAMVRVMERIPFEYAAGIGAGYWTYPSLPADRQRWFSSSDVRGGDYAGTQEQVLLPLDEELIQSMRECESAFMQNAARLETGRKISFEERKRLYLRHLRFWNDFIEKHEINLLLSGIIPHEIPDHIIYCLCKRKGIPTLMFHATFIQDCAFLFGDVDVSAAQAGERFAALKQEQANARLEDIRLGPRFDEYFRAQSDPSGKRAITFRRPTASDRIVGTIRKDLPQAALAFAQWLPANLTRTRWQRRMGKFADWRHLRRLREFYNTHAIQPDFSQPYVYVPLQYQPECSTNPMAGAFVDQQVTIQLLAASVPPDVLLYVKEHPRQHTKGFSCRSIGFYEELFALPTVRLIAHDVSSFLLREHCRAVATGTGTAGFEAIFREKPVFMFGHHFYQYAPGVFPIRTREDCREASEEIFTKGARPLLRDVRLFLRAMEETAVRASLTDWHQAQASDLTPEEHTTAIADACTQALQRMLI